MLITSGSLRVNLNLILLFLSCWLLMEHHFMKKTRMGKLRVTLPSKEALTPLQLFWNQGWFSL